MREKNYHNDTSVSLLLSHVVAIQTSHKFAAMPSEYSSGGQPLPARQNLMPRDSFQTLYYGARVLVIVIQNWPP